MNWTKPISKVSNSQIETAAIFIKMVRKLKRVYRDDYALILRHEVGISEGDVEKLIFTDKQFKNLLSVYLKLNSHPIPKNIERVTLLTKPTGSN
jgi:hypothetical protein